MAAGYTCPVCDYPNLSEPPRSEFGGGSFEICPSCGFQFGVNDDDEGISYETWRRRWEAAGMPWNSLALKQPASWKPVAKHVAPGGAALRRPGEAAAAPVPAEVKAPAPAATTKPQAASPKTPAPKAAVKKPSAPAKKAAKPTAKPTAKPAAKKAPAKKAPAKKASRR